MAYNVRKPYCTQKFKTMKTFSLLWQDFNLFFSHKSHFVKSVGKSLVNRPTGTAPFLLPPPPHPFRPPLPLPFVSPNEHPL
jgi:hypothetical protein